jgi:predicted RNA binding protein YcfA (HicA-like mRNA interferase family)
VNSSKLIKLIQKDGWVLLRVKGSHHQFKHPIKKGTLTIPHPKKDIPKGTVNAILKFSGLKM